MDTPSKNLSKNKWLIAAICIGLGGLGFTAIYAITHVSNGQPVETTAQPIAAPKPEPQISALGRLEPEDEVIKVASPSALGTSRIVDLLVKEGDTVQKGQVIAKLDSYDRAIASLEQVKAIIPQRQSNLEQVKAGAKIGDIEAQKANYMAKNANVLRLKQELDSAIRDAQRYEELLKAGATSEFTRDSYVIKVKSLREQLAQAKEELTQAEGLLKSIKEVRPTDVSIAQAQLDAAIADVKRAEIDVDLSQVKAPITGQVLKVYAKPGETVGTNGVIEIGNTKQMYAVAEIYETDIGKVKVGQKAQITSEVFNGEISGKVDRIGLKIAKNDVLGTDPAAKTDVRIVEVKIRLDDSSKVSGLTNLQVKVRIDS
ncbi:ABC exporter membrane fusion protein, DevB family [Synechococcus sp. PCC 7502]|uniref:ABC exporter membrane fusion protein n=1 Tax=Synechococcus sp. PCC 7502 TaxID=1173263 RepID=UPI00029FA650|nr:ABC exporter membrane fusion protein [Synechococcus sp. PCC 7502]AFY73891.1 ABC exporter membrane fusion protein, DevB family [Synechococcus sp. PCC 7502]